MWDSWWTPGWLRARNAPLQQGRPPASWAALGRTLPAGRKRWSFLSTQRQEYAPGVLGSPVLQRHRHAEGSPVKGREDDWELETFLRGEAEWPGITHSGEEKAQQSSYWNVEMSNREWGREIRAWLSSILHQQERQWATTEIDENPFKHRKTLFFQWVCSDTGMGCPDRLWNVHGRRYWKAIWTQSWAACSRWPCLSNGVGLGYLKRSLHHFAIFMYTLKRQEDTFWKKQHANNKWHYMQKLNHSWSSIIQTFISVTLF